MDDLDLGATIKGFSSGQKVFGRYTLGKIIGRGGLGVVWLARDEELGRDTALKFLPELVTLDRAAVADLKQEVRRMTELAHPHIVKVNDFVTDGRATAVSMEYVEGASLAKLRAAEPGEIFPVEKLLPWLRQLCAALDYAHDDAQVVHRDLKPANVLVDVRGRVKLLDFGIAASITESVSRVSRLDVAGPPSYMSPQQLMGEDPAPADDIYSLGATLHELLVGRPPFNAGNIVAQVQTKPAPPVNECRRAAGLAPVPEIWDQVIASCLAKEPPDRPAKAGDIVTQLETGRAVAKVSPPAAPAPLPAGPAPVPVAAPGEPAIPATPWWKVPAYRWTAAGSAVLVLGLAYWLGDFSGRYAAAQAHAQGLAAKAAGNWAAALPALQSATQARKSDFAYQRDFNEAQEEWLRGLTQQQAGLAPAEAYRALSAGPAELARVLDGPVAVSYRQYADGVREKLRSLLMERLAAASGQAAAAKFPEAYAALDGLKEFSALLPELAGTRLEVRQAEVRAELQAGMQAAGRGDFPTAFARLDAAAQRGLLEPEVAQAREQVKQAARLQTINRLAAAVLAGNQAATQAALDALGGYTGEKFTVTAEQLAGQKNLAGFLRALEELQIRPVAGRPRTSRMDLVLVESLRTRFDQPAEVARFLAQGYAEWAAEELGGNKPGFALYLAARARRDNATLDDALETQARAQLAADFGFAFVLKPTVTTADNARGVRDAVRQQLTALLTRRVGNWAAVSEEAAGKPDGAFELGTNLRGIESSDSRREATKTVRYQSGWSEEANPQHASLTSQVENAEERYEKMAESNRSTQAQAQSLARSGGLSGLAAALTGVASGVSAYEVNKARNQLEQLRAQLANTRETVRRPVYATEKYQEITHNLSYTAALTMNIEQAGRALAPAVAWNSSVVHQTVEVVGNAQRGVPVAAAQYPAAEQVSGLLAQDLGQRIAAEPDLLLPPLLQSTFVVLEKRLTAKAVPAADAADRRWGLAQLWLAAGLAPANLPELENRVRTHLGLPAGP